MSIIQHQRAPEETPYGFCHCGCGKRTTIAPKTNTATGCVKGEPHRFILYHSNRARVAPPEQRFWERVDTSGGPDACWPWTGATKSHKGYGAINTGGKVYPASNYSYRLNVGPLPKGYFVCHHCDNRACCNPRHLFAGTPADNMHDMASKGRSLRGSANPAAKLTEDKVRLVHSLRKEGWSQTRIAKHVGVSQPVISEILLGHNWQHVSP